MQDTLKDFTRYARRNRKEIDQFGEIYLTPTSVAARLDVAPKTVWRWIRSRQLIAYRFGRIYRIPESALRAFLDLNYTASDEDPRSQPPTFQ